MNLRRRAVLHGILAALPSGGLLAGVPRPGLRAAVFNGPELQTALLAAGPGSVVELAPGDYGDAGGRFHLAAGAGRGVRLRVRGEATRAVLRAPLVVEGDEADLEGLALAEGVHLAGGGLKLANAHVGGSGLMISGVGTEVANCEFVGCRGTGVTVSRTGTGGRIHDNRFRDPIGWGKANAAVQVGRGMADTDNRADAVIERNLIERWRAESETICIKSSGVVFRANVLRDCRNLTNRHGEGNLYEGNTLERCGGIVVHDRGNRLIGNRLVGTRSIRVMGGNAATGANVQGTHPQAVDTYLEGNVGLLLVGIQFRGHPLPAVGTVVASHEGQIELRAEVGTRLPAPELPPPDPDPGPDPGG